MFLFDKPSSIGGAVPLAPAPLAPAPLAPPPAVAVRAPAAGPLPFLILERRREGAHLGLAGWLARIDLHAQQRYRSDDCDPAAIELEGGAE